MIWKKKPKFELEMSSEVKELVEERGLDQKSIKAAIQEGEKSGHKLVNKDDGSILAKKEGDNLTTYARYEKIDGDKMKLISAYGHKMSIEGPSSDGEGEEIEEWVCEACGGNAVEKNLDISYLGITRPVLGVYCPDCEQGYVSEDLAVKTLPTAANILEEKRA
ncbi:hypothetical protein AMET1_0783 [Methanonatronarchaeum thermophilum]|uniref:DUF7479 domain-containing protein n=1 Tax=Methanonatronarchaeum thermophilum TaxID=1927129 RepID=A0A1Y3GCE7_9EURY|nr:hypothetical protein [Methanonatronarchaeum thermophilum]OUJ19131.1 hypothetical protein AMET1_0783 [Methanonatronarchaeum thermophilum]